MEIYPLSDYINNNFDLPFDKITNKFIWVPGDYPRNSDKTYSKWNADHVPLCPDGIHKYWTNYEDIEWISIY